MKKLVLVCGPAGIGKSTFAAIYASGHASENPVIIAADEVRKGMTGSYKAFLPGKDMMPVYDRMIEMAKEEFAKEGNRTVIFDTTMLYDERRLYFIDNLPEAERVELILLKLRDYADCLVRNRQRDEEKWVPEEVISSMASNYEDPGEEVLSKVSEYKVIYRDD